ncbi:MAG: OprO/OprP family phosphate-selective porin, partial [Vicinamibacterales bacterium]
AWALLAPRAQILRPLAPAFVQATVAAPESPDRQERPTKGKKQKIAGRNTSASDQEPAPDESIAPPPERGGSWRLGWKQHPSIRVGNLLRLDVEAKLQEDGHSSYGPIDGLAPWQFHRRRLGIKGYLFRHIEYEIEHEFTEQELTDKDLDAGVTPKSRWKDVYLNLTWYKKAQIEAGKFKVPFGLDELTSVTHNDFVYRSLGANYLAPGRDVGAMVHGSFFKHGLTYAMGLFDGDGDNAKSKKLEGGGHTLAGRVTVMPLRHLTSSPAGRLEIGSAFALSQLSDDSALPNGLRGRTVMTQSTFFDSVYVKGQRRRWEADADWTSGPASIRSEFTWVSDDRLGQGIGDENLPDVRARSWYVSGAWILRGQGNARPLKAAEPFAHQGLGAIALAARYERIWFDSATTGAGTPLRNPRAVAILASGDRALTLGINWAVNRFTRIQFNAIREHVEDPARSPVANGAAFWSRVIRLQFVL